MYISHRSVLGPATGEQAFTATTPSPGETAALLRYRSAKAMAGAIAEAQRRADAMARLEFAIRPAASSPW
jgi:hypothetical protein